MVAERMTCVGLERSRSSRVFSPTGIQFAAPAHKVDDCDVHQGGDKRSPLRRRSQSQNQIHRMLSLDAPSYQLKASVSPLTLRNLPLPSFSDTSIISSNGKGAAASSSGKQPPKPSLPVQLIPLQRVLPLDAQSKSTDFDTGNQSEATWEDDENSTTTSEDTENSSDNQFDHLHQRSIVTREKKHFATVFDSESLIAGSPQSSPKPSFLPRLATLDLVGDSRHLLRHSSSSVSPSKKHWSRIDRICDEILTTERSYVQDLRTLLHHFFTPLQEYAIKYTINLGAMNALHASIRTILHIHRELLRQMMKRCTSDVDNLSNKAEEEDDDDDNGNESDGYDDDDWLGAASTTSMSSLSSTPRQGSFGAAPYRVASALQVTAAFDFTIEFMKVYAFYCSSYLSAKEELAVLQKKYPGINVLTTELDEHARRDLRVDIVSLMIKPVQRICRYPLLFRELLKNASSSEQAEVIERTLCKIERVSTHVNEKVREAQNNARLYELHQTIDPKAKIDLLQPSRTLLSETTVRVVNLDTPCWPSFLLKLGRKRPWCSDEQQSDSASRRDSVETILSSPLLSPRSSLSSGFMSLSPSSSIMRPPLLHRRSSGEKLRLILLSDVLLMAKKQEEKLKIKRQLCLSCAHITDTSTPTDSTPTAQPRYPCSFMMEVSKVGRCNCHQLTPVTLKRSPKRRNSLSLSIPTDLLGARQSKQISPHSNATTQSQQQQKSSGFFRGSEFASPFRSTKRYVVICESEQKKTEFVVILHAPISQPKSPVQPEPVGSSSSEQKMVDQDSILASSASDSSASGKNDELKPQDLRATDGLDLI